MRYLTLALSVALTSLTFLLFFAPKSYACSISVYPNTFSPTYNGVVSINTDCTLNPQTYTIFTHPQFAKPSTYSNFAVDRKIPRDQTIASNLNLKQGNIGRDNPGPWTLEVCAATVLSECNEENIIGRTTIMVTTAAASSPGPTESLNNSALSPCYQWLDKNGNKITEEQAKKQKGVKCGTVDTAIGKISTEPQAFVRSIYSIVLGFAGGIALLLVIIAGYRIMVSQGNPEALKEATGQLMSAVIGLLFIIFSFVILQIVGVDILQIPGFGK